MTGLADIKEIRKVRKKYVVVVLRSKEESEAQVKVE